jgi:hypothetical protein
MPDITPRRTSGVLLVVAFGLHLGGVLIFNGRFFFGWFPQTTAWYTWERSLFIAAYAAAALGVDLLGSMVREAGRAVFGRLAGTAFLIAAVLAIVVEASFLSTDAGQTPFVVVMVVTLFLAEAVLGWSMVGSRLMSDWIGWAVVAWNAGWLVVLVAVAAEDIYYPILHFVPLLVIGIGLLRRQP